MRRTIGYLPLEEACRRVHSFPCLPDVGWGVLLEGRAMQYGTAAGMVQLLTRGMSGGTFEVD